MAAQSAAKATPTPANVTAWVPPTKAAQISTGRTAYTTGCCHSSAGNTMSAVATATIVTSAGIGARDSNREGRAHDTMTLATTSTPRASPNHHFPKTRKKLELPDCLAKSNAVAAPTSAPTSGPTTTAEVT